ncbi:MAG: hypothetical protein NVSMB48_09170 [Marmoricola sp.]
MPPHHSSTHVEDPIYQGAPTESDRVNYAVTPRPGRFRTKLLAAAAVLLAVTGCSSGESAPSDKHPNENTPAAATSPIANARQQFEDALTGHSGTLSTDGLPAQPPKGFTRADVTTFADQILAMVERGISPDVQDKTGDNAVNFVLEGLYPATVRDYKAGMEAAAGTVDWQFVLASRFEVAPTEPARVLAARWKVSTKSGVQDDGTRAPILIVAFEAFIRHDVPVDDATGQSAPIVVRRTLTMSGFRPRGGDLWWPGLRTSASSYDDDGCSLSNDGILRPAESPAAVKDARKRIVKALADDGLTAPSEASNPRELRKFVKRHC